MSREPEELALVEALAVRMRRKLRMNAHKAHWDSLALPDLLQWFKGEVTELEEALANEGPEAIADEAADVANFAAMIAVRALSLPPRTEIRPPYVRLGNTAMRRTRNGYYRNFGEWGINDGFIDGRHVAIVNPAHPDTGHFHGMPLVPISREEYLRDGAEDVSAFNSGNPDKWSRR